MEKRGKGEANHRICFPPCKMKTFERSGLPLTEAKVNATLGVHHMTALTTVK